MNIYRKKILSKLSYTHNMLILYLIKSILTPLKSSFCSRELIMVIYLYGTDRSQFTCYFLRFNIFHYIFLKYKIANILKLNIFIFVANIFIINIYIKKNNIIKKFKFF